MTQQDMQVTPHSDSTITRLLKLGGERATPRPEAVERARVLAHRSWRRMLDEQAARHRTRWRRIAWSAASALAAAIGIVAFLVRGDLMPAPLDAHVERVAGTVELRRRNGETVLLRAGERLWRGVVTTSRDGRISIRAARDLSMRLNHATRLQVDDTSRVTLLSGAIYVDSGPGAMQRVPLVISTPAGEVRHLGTQFRVEIASGATRVSVRDGSVQMAAGRTTLVGAGEEVLVNSAGEIARRRIATFGSDWEWAASIGPQFDIENRSAVEFLSWIAREHGWLLRFNSEETRRAAAAAVLHGSIEGLSVDDSLQRVSAITGLSLSISGGVLTVGASGVPGAPPSSRVEAGQ